MSTETFPQKMHGAVKAVIFCSTIKIIIHFPNLNKYACYLRSVYMF